MISLRTIKSFSAVAAAVFFAACSDGLSNPQRGIAPGGADLDGKVGNVGNAAKNGDIDVRVALDKAGNALLMIRTGTFVPATGVHTPNGYFTSIQYKIYDASGRQVQVKNVKFRTDGISVYAGYIDLCSSKDDDDDDDDHHDAMSCAKKYGAGWKVSVQANLKGVAGDPKKTDVVREDGVNGFLPDVDMTAQAITVLGASGPVTSVPSGGPTVFTVTIPNNKPAEPNGPGSMAVNATCVVTVDGVIQLPIPNVQIFGVWTNPNAFSYVNDPSNTIPAGGTQACQFKLTLPPGPHVIKVTAAPILPGDFDYSNNTTAGYTFISVSAPPDVAATTFQINGATPPATVNANTPLEFDQWVSLLAGSPPGNVTCTMTVTNVATNATVTLPTPSVVVSLPTANATAACRFQNVVLPSTGDYDVTTTVTLGAGLTDANPANNTATFRVKAPNAAPSANIALGPINFSNPNYNTLIGANPTDITGTLGGVAQPEDSVHNKDIVTFSTPFTANVQNAPGGVSLTCSATIQIGTGAAVNANTLPGFAWADGSTGATTTVSGVTSTSNSKCAFTLPFNGTTLSASGQPYTVKFSISNITLGTTAITNGAPAASQTVSGVVTEFVRADLYADPWQLVGTTTTPLTGNGVKQNTTVTIQTVVHNPSNVAAQVNCGRLAVNLTQPTTSAYPAADTLPSALSPVTVTTTTQSLTANGGTATCQYRLTAPGNLGLVSFPITAIMTTPTGNVPQDPNYLNNPATGIFTIVSNGQFTRIPDPAKNPEGIFARQEWLAPIDFANNGLLNGLPVPSATITQQVYQARDMALLLIPTNAQLGTFKLSDTIYVNGTKIGVANIPFTQLLNDGQCISAPAGTPLTSAIKPNLVFAGDICGIPAAQAGFTEVYVNVVQSLLGTAPMSTSPVIYNGELLMKIVLDFTLPSSSIPDKVVATVSISLGQMSQGCMFSPDLITMTCSSLFNPFVVNTP